MSKKVGIFSRSAGCGKTTSGAYLAIALTMVGKKVQLLDLKGDLVSLIGQPENDEISISGFTFSFNSVLSKNLTLDSFDEEKDYILLDIPKDANDEELDLIFENIDEVIVPIEAEFYGLEELNISLNILAKYENVNLKGLLLTHCNSNSDYSNTLATKLEAYFPNRVFESKIFRNYYLSLPEFRINSLRENSFHGGFINYLKLANEIIEHEY